jgi:hypothetical protein
MAESSRDSKDNYPEKGDEVLRRLLKTPPDPQKEKRRDDSRRPPLKEDSENSRDAK